MCTILRPSWARTHLMALAHYLIGEAVFLDVIKHDSRSVIIPIFFQLTNQIRELTLNGT